MGRRKGKRMSISVAEHRAAVEAQLELAAQRRLSRSPMIVPIHQATAAMSLAAPITSRRHVPAFDNSQMDGYAVSSSDLAEAAESNPITLQVGPTIAAGAALGSLAPQSAAPIMTGAPIPMGADAVVRVEDASPSSFESAHPPDKVSFSKPVKPGTFIRTRGSDLQSGETIAAAGSAVTPAVIGAAVGADVDTLTVHTPLSVAIISTGSEIAAGQVLDSNGAMLSHALSDLGLSSSRYFVTDSAAELDQLLARVAPHHDLIVTTGGVSAGAFEVVREFFSTGSEHWFGKVALQPGGPQGLAIYDSGQAATPVVCLPGNPVSVLVSFELFLRPTLARVANRLDADRPVRTGDLAESVTSPDGIMQLRRGRFIEGKLHLVGGPSSHLLAAYAQCDALILIAADVTKLQAGTTVEWWQIL